jgi:GNAT superfamily N-acetyltransferase
MQTVTTMHKKITEDLSIIEFEMRHAKAFKDLNIAWIAKSFFVEESDERVLSDPEKYFLNAGGRIILAEYKGVIVGTCALMPANMNGSGIDEGKDTFELTKMAVDEKLRGLKIGYHLGVATLDLAKEMGATRVILHSNKEGSAPAIQLYYTLGFKEIPLGDAPWARANIKMEIEL